MAFINRVILIAVVLLAMLPIAFAEDKVLVTDRYTLNVTDNGILDYKLEKLPRIARPVLDFLRFGEDNTFAFTPTSFDRINLIFQGKTYIVYFSEVTVDSFVVEFQPKAEKIKGMVGSPFIANLSDGEDLEFTVNDIYSYEDRYRKVELHDYRLNISMVRVPLGRKVELPIREHPVENKTEEPVIIPPKEGKVDIVTKERVTRPVSFIIGTIIIGVMILSGLGLYNGWKRLAA